jgi:putative DNA primase/helicase
VNHLELLLSKIYDGALAPEHLADLRKSGLTDATIAAQFIRSVPPALIPRLLGFDMPSVRSALLFPFRSPAGGFMDHVRVKIFPPRADAAGHTVKYLQPKGSAPRLYFVTACLQEVLEGEGPVWVVEGEKKALAVAQRGLPALGFCGVEGWHAGGERRLLSDFDAIRLRDRIVELLPDGDYQTNPNVKRAIQRFGAALAMRGARPRVVLLPSELPR